MRLDRPFLKLPIRFDADALAADVRALPSEAWSAHPTGFTGNEAVRLVTPDGQPTDSAKGAMAPTAALQMSGYIREVMAEIGAVWGRGRLMGLAPGGEVPWHVDTAYYWRTHWRIHIPVITNPGVQFTCGEETVHMAAGECWLFDSFRRHRVDNFGSAQRIHLVLDTVGGGRLPELIAAAQRGEHEAPLLRSGERSGEGLLFEKFNLPSIMSPWEMRCHLAFLADHAGGEPLLHEALGLMDQFTESWAAAWALYGAGDEGLPTYSRLLAKIRSDLTVLGGENLRLDNNWPLYGMFEMLILGVALGPEQMQAAPGSAIPRLRKPSPVYAARA